MVKYFVSTKKLNYTLFTYMVSSVGCKIQVSFDIDGILMIIFSTYVLKYRWNKQIRGFSFLFELKIFVVMTVENIWLFQVMGWSRRRSSSTWWEHAWTRTGWASTRSRWRSWRELCIRTQPPTTSPASPTPRWSLRFPSMKDSWRTSPSPLIGGWCLPSQSVSFRPSTMPFPRCQKNFPSPTSVTTPSSSLSTSSSLWSTSACLWVVSWSSVTLSMLMVHVPGHSCSHVPRVSVSTSRVCSCCCPCCDYPWPNYDKKGSTICCPWTNTLLSIAWRVISLLSTASSILWPISSI